MTQNEFKSRFERYARLGTLVFTLLVLYWLIQMAITIYFVVTGDAPPSETEQSFFNLIYSLLFGVFVVAIMVMVIRLLQSIRKGSTPFTMANVRRLRRIGWMLVVFEVLQRLTTRLFWTVASGRVEDGEKVGVYEGLIATYKADTIEELAEKVGIDPATLVKTVDRYNELCEKGVDEDFGKEAKWLVPITQPPFYGMHRHIGLSAIMKGVNVDENMQVVRADGTPIPDLFAIGNLAGNFYGSPDYPMTVPGMSLGRCHTMGYVCGNHVASL